MQLSFIIFFVALFSAHALDYSDCSRVVTRLIQHLELPAAKHKLVVESVWEVLNDSDPDDRKQVLGILESAPIVSYVQIQGRIPFAGAVGNRQDVAVPEQYPHEWVMLLPEWTYHSPYQTLIMIHEPFHVGQGVRGELDGTFETYEDIEPIETAAYRHQYRYTRLLYTTDELTQLKEVFPSDRYETLARRLRTDNILEWNETDQLDYFRIDTKALRIMRLANKEFDDRISLYFKERAAKRFVELVERALTLTEERFLELCLAPYKDRFKNKK